MLRRLLPSLLICLLLIPTLTSQSLWWDEGISLHLAGLSWREIFADRAENIHPPLYFLILSGWTALVGRTPFAARYLSALATLLLPALVYRFLGRRVERRAGRAAGLLAALAPPFLIYGQETRAYALLLLWVLALWSLVWLPKGQRDRTWRSTLRRGVLLGVVQVGLVLSHYQGVIAIAIAALWLLWDALRRDRRRHAHPLAEWLIGAAVSAVLALPWLVYMASVGLEGLRGQAGLGNVLAEAVPAGYLASLIGMFHTVGMPEALNDPALVRPSWLAGLLLLGALGCALRRACARQAVLPVLAIWLLPLLSAPLIWTLSPQSHPRYIYPFIIGGWLASAVLVASGLRQRSASVWQRAWSGALLGALLVTSILGIRAYLLEPAYARTDVRGAAAYIAAHARHGDITLVSHTDWSLAQYDLGAARLVMVEDTASLDVLVDASDLPVRVYALDYDRNTLDPGNALRALLAWNGALVERRAFHGVFLEVYEQTSAAPAPVCIPISLLCVEGTGLCLTGAAYQISPVSGAALPVQLCWKGASGDARYGVAFRLYAPSGALVVALDEMLVDGSGQPASAWSDKGAASYHILPLPVGLLPQPYRLEVGVYDVGAPDAVVTLTRPGDAPLTAMALGVVVPLAAPWQEPSSYGLALPDTVVVSLKTPTLSIDGVGLDRSSVAPGQTLYVTLLGRATGTGTETGELAVGLRRDGRWIVREDAMPLLSGLPSGRPVALSVALIIPAGTEGGDVEVVVEAERAAVLVGQLAIDPVSHRYDVPAVAYPVDARAGGIASLLGFDIAPGPLLNVGEPCTLTLVWRAEADMAASAWAAADLKVFAHLMVGDVIAAQRDAVPANWTRPTPGWVPNEIIIDDHALTWQRWDVTGKAVLKVGLYDPATGQRVIWASDQDAFTLPLELVVGRDP